MKTAFLKKKLQEILYKIIKNAEVKQNFELKYCDKFTDKSALDMVISVDLSIYNEGNDENEVTKVYCNWVSVNKFDCLDESGLELLMSQRKELVQWVDEFVYKFYSNY